MEPFVKMFKSFRPLIIFAKSSILDFWLGSECASSQASEKTLKKGFHVIFEALLGVVKIEFIQD